MNNNLERFILLIISLFFFSLITLSNIFINYLNEKHFIVFKIISILCSISYALIIASLLIQEFVQTIIIYVCFTLLAGVIRYVYNRDSMYSYASVVNKFVLIQLFVKAFSIIVPYIYNINVKDNNLLNNYLNLLIVSLFIFEIIYNSQNKFINNMKN